MVEIAQAHALIAQAKRWVKDEVLRDHQDPAPELVISKRHEEWVSKNSDPVYTDRALAFAAHQLACCCARGTVSAELWVAARVSSSSLHRDAQAATEAKAAMKMQNGSFMHLRWQMEGLSEGWLMQAEVPVNPYQLSGTMDGVLYDNSSGAEEHQRQWILEPVHLRSAL